MVEPRGIAARVRFCAGKAADFEATSSIETPNHPQSGNNQTEALATGREDTLSFIAILDETDIIGNVLLSAIEGPERALALAPLSIRPQWRDMQIGTALVRHALDQARRAGWHAVFVYGQPDYYRRFGFRSDLADCARSDLQGPRLMALELLPGALADWSGPIEFPSAFQENANPAHR